MLAFLKASIPRASTITSKAGASAIASTNAGTGSISSKAFVTTFWTYLVVWEVVWSFSSSWVLSAHVGAFK